MAKKTTAKKSKAKKTTAKKAKPVKKVNKAKVVKKTKTVKKTKVAKPVKKAAVKKTTVKKTVTKKSTAKKTTAVKAKPVVQKAAAPKNVAPKKVVPKNIDYTKAITPLGDRLVVRLTQTERVTAGGLILPDSVSTTFGYLKGEVLAAGQGTYTKKGHHKMLDVKVGDVVLFNEYSSTKVKYNNEDLHIVHENEVLGVTE